MELYAGSSGYSYKEWKGRFYPEKLAAAKMLQFYAERLPTVEINNTFYRLPKADTLRSWSDQVPEEFRFSIKASRKITHFKKLADCHDELEFLLSGLEELGPKLGAVLFQLPPYLRCSLERLASFLDLLPDSFPAAFEFRHASWSEQPVFDLLAERNFAWVVADTDENPQQALVSTSDWGYLRLRRSSYDKSALQRWYTKIDKSSWDRAMIFFKHEDEAAAPELAQQLMSMHS